MMQMSLWCMSCCKCPLESMLMMRMPPCRYVMMQMSLCGYAMMRMPLCRYVMMRMSAYGYVMMRMSACGYVIMQMPLVGMSWCECPFGCMQWCKCPCWYVMMQMLWRKHNLFKNSLCFQNQGFLSAWNQKYFQILICYFSKSHLLILSSFFDLKLPKNWWSLLEIFE